jgi:type IV pilus assembly protein PilX
MAGNLRDRGIAFQASEAALSQGEDKVNYIRGVAPVCDGALHNSFICFANLDRTPASSVQYFDDAAFTANGNVTTMSLITSANVYAEPIFVLEELANFTPDDGGALDESAAKNITELTSYRVTSKGVGQTADSQVIIQSTYNRSAH